MAPQTRCSRKKEMEKPVVVPKTKASTAERQAPTKEGEAKGKAPRRGGEANEILQAPDERTYLLLLNYTDEVEPAYEPQDAESFDEDPFAGYSYSADRDCVIGLIQKLKMKSEIECQNEFNNLVSYLKDDYLKKRDISPEEAYNQALQAVIKKKLGDAKKREEVSDRIGQYIDRRLNCTRRTFVLLLELAVWDDEVLNLIIVTIEELKDLLVHFPELEELLSLTMDTLKANAKWKASMAGLLRDYIPCWLMNMMYNDITLKEWAKQPSEIIQTSRKRKYPC